MVLANPTQVYSLYAVLLVSTLSRLPIKLPNQKTVGKRHAQSVGGDDDKAVTFADVAGVDEAKEELQEVVVRWLASPFALLFLSVADG
jgi:ATP-dependent Zn protease